MFDNVSVTGAVTAPAAPIVPNTLPTMGELVLEDDAVDFSITGEPESNWILQESTDLEVWTSLQTLSLPGGTVHHSEGDDRGEKRFFRLQAAP